MKKFTMIPILCLFASISSAATIRVPQDQPTIQAGIDAAVDGDTVLVDDGRYTGTGNVNLNFKRKAITVKSVNGAAATIIDCQSGTGGVTFQSGETAASVLDGFTITNGRGGIECSASSPTITNCTITENSGFGILCNSGSRPTITNCTVTLNSGNGIATASSSSPSIINSTIAQNLSSGFQCNSGSRPTITNCTITGNTATGNGGGIWCLFSSSPTITNCTITGNTANNGGGIYCDASSPTITNSIIAQNNAANNGGGIYAIKSSRPTITNCTVTENTSAVDGGAFFIGLTSFPTITNAILWGNTATSGGNEVWLWPTAVPASVTITFSDVQGGFAAIEGDKTDIANSTYEDNIDADPLFVDAANGDYHLSAGSPCLSAGTANGAPSTDLEGRSRPLGSGVDIGAYEQFDNGALVVPVYRLTLKSAPTGVAMTVSPADNNGNSDGSTPFSQEYNSGTSVTLTTPGTLGTQVFDHWEIDSVTVSSEATITVTMDADHTATARYRTLVLGFSSVEQAIYEGDVSGPITLEIREADGNPATSSRAVTVTLVSSVVTGAFDTAQDGAFDGTVTSVTIPAGQTSATVFYKDTAAGTATIKATAEGFPAEMQTAAQEVTVSSAVTSATVSGSPVRAGKTATVRAVGKPGAQAIFSVGDMLTDIAMTESTEEAGTYTGAFTPVVGVHPDGTYDVVVKIGISSFTVIGGVVIDKTAPVLVEVTADPMAIKNGQTLALTVKSESRLSVSAVVLELDTTEPEPVAFAESETEPGTYSASIVISQDNTAENGLKTVTITATDAAGNATDALVTIDLRNFAEFNLSIPQGISLIHLPLTVKSVNDQPMVIQTIGDLYDAIGSDNVSFIITFQPGQGNARGAWSSFLGKQSRGTPTDWKITDDLGIIAVMKNPVTLHLKGDALGKNGASQMKIAPGTNLIGVPLKGEKVKRVSDLLTLEGFRDKVTSIIVSDGGEFKVVARPGDKGDIPITGGQSFIIIARAAGVAELTGVAWDNVSSSSSAAPPLMVVGHQVDESTPVLALHGAVVDEVTTSAKRDSAMRNLPKDGFRVTLKNLSTGAFFSTLSNSAIPGSYSVTFVDAISSRAARVGDVLEIRAESPSPRIGVQPLRYIVTTDDVLASQIRLPDFIAYEIPKETKLLPNYPNPFNPETWIPFRLAKDSFVTLWIYDVTGAVVRTFEVGHKPAAVYESRDKAIYWDGQNNFGERVASGVYFYTLTANDFTATRKMLILK